MTDEPAADQFNSHLLVLLIKGRDYIRLACLVPVVRRVEWRLIRYANQQQDSAGVVTVGHALAHWIWPHLRRRHAHP